MVFDKSPAGKDVFNTYYYSNAKALRCKVLFVFLLSDFASLRSIMNAVCKITDFLRDERIFSQKKHSAMLKSKKHARKLSRINYLSRLEILSTSQVTPL